MIRPITFDEQIARAKDDGGVYRNIYPHDGILWGCEITSTSTEIEIASGLFTMCGRMIWVDGKTVFPLEEPLQNGYAQLKSKIDLNNANTQEECAQWATEIVYSTTANFPQLTQEDINGTGKIYEQELAVVKLENGNITEITRKLQNAGIDAEKLGGKFPEYYAPVGAGFEFYGDTPPDGYLFADGSAVSRTEYAALFAILGTKYGGGNGSTTFNLPDRRGRVGVGRNSETFNVLGKKGGTETHQLITNELPAHNHVFTGASATTSSSGGHAHTPSVNTNFMTYETGQLTLHQVVPTASGGMKTAATAATSSNGAHTHTLTAKGNIGNTGNSKAHNNLQPYLVCNYIIKY